ncbi:prolyl-tRNA synthetase [Candidatus Peregrinibacteria bacterium]|jgi:prolyl-tRNA synthetase|nr:prolyl-tRNA synthetase [Candidatus Peregrinibacteria bacterium]MBT5468669.1 prolyl-tRNA synthetase [Candidatus Peregrinibacteria bacterium]MBT7337833.1 prolyl-tRNA synthetase [Candidatus Peregrinibacteria bacterium]
MYLSQLFTRTSKETQSDASSINADLLTRAGFIHKTMAGAYSYLPLGLIVLRKVENVVREEMNSAGGQEILMSALSPKQNWVTTDRWEGFDALFKMPASGDTEYALNPTHEEIVTPLVKEYVSSYKNLPFGCYQIQTKFRNEPRAKSGILRGREFLMKDLYSFHADQESLDEYYEVMHAAYNTIFERLGLADKTYYTYASGGSFSQFSHEFQVVLSQGEDTIYVSVDAEKKGMNIAINKEIFEEGVTKCPETGGTSFREEKGSEGANIFKLGTKFSEPFKLQFTDQDGKMFPITMGCYGIGVSRLMGIMVEAFADDDGMRWTEEINPADFHIVPISKTEDDESYKKAVALYDRLAEEGKTAIFDDRLKASVGAKLADADLIGCPKRIVISPKTLEGAGAELKNRITGEVMMVAIDSI